MTWQEVLDELILWDLDEEARVVTNNECGTNSKGREVVDFAIDGDGNCYLVIEGSI